jgi:chemotaxis protein CheX
VDAVVINQFLTATVKVLHDYFQVDIEQNEPPKAIRGDEALDEVTVLLGIVGDLEGHFLLGCSTPAALGIARNMMGNQEYPAFDDLCASALAELGNMIAGTTMTQLAGLGHSCNLLPPSVLRAEHALLKLSVPIVIKLPLKTSVGGIAVCIGLKETGKG